MRIYPTRAIRHGALTEPPATRSLVAAGAQARRNAPGRLVSSERGLLREARGSGRKSARSYPSKSSPTSLPAPKVRPVAKQEQQSESEGASRGPSAGSEASAGRKREVALFKPAIFLQFKVCALPLPLPLSLSRALLRSLALVQSPRRDKLASGRAISRRRRRRYSALGAPPALIRFAHESHLRREPRLGPELGSNCVSAPVWAPTDELLSDNGSGNCSVSQLHTTHDSPSRARVRPARARFGAACKLAPRSKQSSPLGTRQPMGRIFT